ncbi:MAG: sodium-dependent transporter [Nitrospinota bacterium]
MEGQKPAREYFSSRWGLLAASLGCAIGVGNIWRFPRLAAEHGGGAFLVPWLIFLFLWSIPLIIAEYSLGRKTREGVVGTFANFDVKNHAWMGAFIALVASAVMFYYAVIVGWCFYYLFLGVGGHFLAMEPGQSKEVFLEFATSNVTPLYQFIPLLICGAIVYRGGVKGIEKMNMVLIPMLFVLLILAAIRALTLDGAFEGVKYLFIPRWEYLAKHTTWIEALAQSAWSTGAGFGLFLTYAVYVKKKENVVAHSVATAVGNNIASIIAALAVIPTVFAFLPVDKATEALQAGSVGLTFFWLPELFAKMPFGSLFGSLFFLSLIFAGLSSLISLVELPTRMFMDFGLTRHRAVVIVIGVSFILGLPSALSLDFLDNQDAVWGQGLIISGMMVCFLVIRYGTTKFHDELLTSKTDMKVHKWFDFVIRYVIPLEFVLLMGWWLYNAVQKPEWWNPFAVSGLGTSLFQWGAAIIVFVALNKTFKRKVAPIQADNE